MSVFQSNIIVNYYCSSNSEDSHEAFFFVIYECNVKLVILVCMNLDMHEA